MEICRIMENYNNRNMINGEIIWRSIVLWRSVIDLWRQIVLWRIIVVWRRYKEKFYKDVSRMMCLGGRVDYTLVAELMSFRMSAFHICI